MRRRKFIAGLGSAAAWPLAAWAQGDRVRRIGVLMGGDENDPVFKLRYSVFFQALTDLGWTDDRNMRMDLRWAGDDINRFRALAQELVGLRPDIILTHTTVATVAVQRETRTIPIIFVAVGDPVASDIVPRLDRPGGNATGFATNEASLGEASGLSCSRRSRPGSSGPPSCSIPTSPSDLCCPHLRRRPGHPSWGSTVNRRALENRARPVLPPSCAGKDKSGTLIA